MRSAAPHDLHNLIAAAADTCPGRNGIDPDFWPALQAQCPACRGLDGPCLVRQLKDTAAALA